MRHLMNFSRSAARRRTAPQRLGYAALGAAALSLLGLPAAHAQTYIYSGGGGTAAAPLSGFFSTGFSPVLTANGNGVYGGATTGLAFGGSTNYTATDDLASELDISSLVFTNSGAVTVAQGAGTTLTEAGATSIALNNTGALNFGLNLANGGFLTTFSGAGSGVFSGVFSGAGGLTLGTAGTGGAAGTGYTGNLTLLNANTFTGGTIINSGTLTLNDGAGNATGTGGGSNFGAVRGVVTVNSGGTLILASNNALGYNNDGSQVTLVNINGGLVTTTSGVTGNEGYLTSFSLTGGTLAYTAANNFNSSYQFAAADALAPGITSNASAITSLISGGLNIRSGNLGFTVAKGTTASGVDLDVTGLISNGNNGSGITKNGAGTLSLDNAANNFTGNIVVNGGTLTTGAQFNNGNTGLGSDGAAGRTITVNNSGTLSFTTNNVFGGGYVFNTNIPTLIINSGGLVTSSNYNAIGAVTLNGGTLTQNSVAGSGTARYQGYQFIGNVTVGGTTASTISNGPTGAGDHLGTNTTFNVAKTGAAGPDLIVSAPLLNSSGDYNSGAAGALTKTGAGTMALNATSSYSGGTTITGGTLALNAASADGTGTLNVGSGTTVQTGVSGALGTALAPGGAVTLTAGTIQNTDLSANDPTPGVSHPGISNDTQKSGTLTLGAGASILDFGAGNTGAIFSFADSSAINWLGTLKVYDYTGLPPTTYDPATQVGTVGGGGLDQLFFGNSSTGLTQAQLNDIMFYSGQGTGLYTGPTVILADGEVTAAPEPSVWAGLGFTALAIGGLLLRKRKAGELAA